MQDVSKIVSELPAIIAATVNNHELWSLSSTYQSERIVHQGFVPGFKQASQVIAGWNSWRPSLSEAQKELD